MLRARLVLIPHFAVVQLVGKRDVGMAAQLAVELFIMLVVQLDVPQHITRRENATKQQFMKVAVQLAAQLAARLRTCGGWQVKEDFYALLRLALSPDPLVRSIYRWIPWFKILFSLVFSFSSSKSASKFAFCANSEISLSYES